MNESARDAVVDELIAKAVSHLGPVARQVRDALGNLENREVLGAIAGLTGCEEAMNRANLILIIARDYAEKLARARAVSAETASEPQKPASSEASTGTDLPQAKPDAAMEVVLSEAGISALEPIDVIASGYEFNCPKCEAYNTLIAIPKYGTAIECHNCHVRFRVGEATDAH